MKEIYLAGGCFWGTEHFLKQINGVTETAVGYANSSVESPCYKEVCGGKTGAVEGVKVLYNPSVLPLAKLLTLFFKTIDPTLLNRQGGDFGEQYRTGVYYTDKNDIKTIQEEMERLRQGYQEEIVTEVAELGNFYSAEEYHQDYLDKNPKGYCHLSPALFQMAREAN